MTEPQKMLGNISFPKLDINLDTYQVKVNDEIVPFTPKVEILYLFASHRSSHGSNRSSTKSEAAIIMVALKIDTHIKRIRQKIQTSEDTACADHGLWCLLWCLSFKK